MEDQVQTDPTEEALLLKGTTTNKGWEGETCAVVVVEEAVTTAEEAHLGEATKECLQASTGEAEALTTEDTVVGSSLHMEEEEVVIVGEVGIQSTMTTTEMVAGAVQTTTTLQTITEEVLGGMTALREEEVEEVLEVHASRIWVEEAQVKA